MKVAVAGGSPQTICDAEGNPRGGTWNRDGVILFASAARLSILRVSAEGGSAIPVTKPPQDDPAARHQMPWFLPDGVHFLYAAASARGAAVYVGSLRGGPAVRVLTGIYGAYAAPGLRGEDGYLLFNRERALTAVPFDLQRLRITGREVSVAENVGVGVKFEFPLYGISEQGTLAYATGYGAGLLRERVWMDRTGKRLGAVAKPARYAGWFAISPDEDTVAVSIATDAAGRQGDIWLEDVSRGVRSRFTFRAGVSVDPIWSPDGTRVAYRFFASGTDVDVFEKGLRGGDKEQLLSHGRGDGSIQDAKDWSPDGKLIVFQQRGPLEHGLGLVASAAR